MPPVPPQVTLAAPRIWVERTFPVGDPTTDEQEMEIRQFATIPAKVKAEASRTINTGNYESIRISVGVELPCYLEEVENGLSEASTMVATFLNNEEEGIRAGLAQQRRS